MWKVKPPAPALSRIFARKLGVSPIIAQILINRGIHTIEQGRGFLGGELDQMHKPLLFKDMGKAVARILKAVRTGERILVYGDYDADGVTAAALLSKVLQRLGADAASYVPNRLVEGYGLDLAVLQKELDKGTSLVITVDCGISDLAEIRWAQENSIDLIVTDHHEPPEEIPPAFAVINPKCVDSGYPFKELAGAGVALKLGQALLEAAGQGSEAWRDYLDLACLGTIADIVPIQGENRILVKHGLPALAGAGCPGIQALIETSGIKDKDIGTREVAFGLAPRLNAAGRTGAPELALQLLLTDNYGEAVELAGRLNRANQERQRIESAVLEEALGMLDRDEGKKESSVLALASENWHPGVIGIVASRLTDRFYKPALLISIEGDEGRGSARSIPGFNIHKALAHCQDLLLDYGGHALAAGFTIKKTNIEIFFRKLEAYAREATSGEKLLPLLEIDGLVDIEQVSETLINEINLLRPFGHANPDPLLGCRGARLIESRGVGKGSAHLKMRLGGSNKILDGIGFNLGAYAEVLATGEAVDLAFVPDINEYNGRRSVQLAVKDLGAPAVFAPAEGREDDGDCLAGYCYSPAGETDDERDDLFVPEFVYKTLQKLDSGEHQGLVKCQRPAHDVQLIDCRDAGDRPLRLAGLAAAGEPALVITSCGYQNVELAHHIVLSNPSLRGKVAFCHYHTPGEIKNKLASLFQAGEIDILLTTPAAAVTAGLCAEKVLLYHLPYCLESVHHTYNCVSPGGRLYLLYGAGDLQDNLDGLESLAPGREYMAYLYRMLRREGKQGAVFNIDILAKAMSDAGFYHAGACTLQMALKIFVELELLTCHNEGKILNIHFMPPPAQKKDLFQAQTYKVLTQIKKDSIQLMRDFLSAPVYNLFSQGVSF
ncbi:single-stranded-DNA-specific exonuclease RecJ [Pelotomaculum propionicicum]|uniref:single-stranded-DNA-specific exonuclease RecJ n=1 Tax=Pelotomaculum propionicicum TaxID=258475 RepID=UPI003B7C885C